MFGFNMLFKNYSRCGIHFSESIRYAEQSLNLNGFIDIRKDLIRIINAAR